MFIEIEKKFELTDSEYEIIKSKLKLKWRKTIIDEYMDTVDFQLTKSWKKFRIRNGKKELKIQIWQISCEEYEWNEAMQKLRNNWYEYDELKKIFNVTTHRETYTWKHNKISYIVDIDRHEHGTRYEVEVSAKNEENGIKLINTIIIDLQLKWNELPMSEWKWMLHAKKQNPQAYKILLANNIQL
jgi:uncharacterized protein YjbK